MLTSNKTRVLLALLLLLLLPLPSTPTTLYVTPTPHTLCPTLPCYTLSQYVDNATEYFRSNATMIFLPGEHALKVQANVTNITSFSMVGESEGTSRIICSGSGCGGFYFENIWHLNIRCLSFVSVSHSITAVHVGDLQLVNCTFANSSNTALIAHNTNLLLDGNTFVNNSGGASQMTFTPGGGFASVFSNITFQGKNTFLNNMCRADVCRGGAVYAESSNVNLEGNTSFINNMAISIHQSSLLSGGGGLFLMYATISITGYVSFINNSASSAVTVALTCECGGGGVSLLNCNASISGRVTFMGNLAKGESACGGGVGLFGGSMTITGRMLLTNNYAGLQGGGIDMEDGNVKIGGAVTLTNNSAGSFGGGICTIGSSVNITGSLLLRHNNAGYQGGGMEVENTGVYTTGTVLLTNNSAAKFGGGINAFDSTMDITGSVLLTDNYAGYQSGGIDLSSSSMYVAGIVSLVNGSAGSYGGGIFMVASSVHVNTTGVVLVTGNYAGFQSGGMNMQDSSVNFTGSVLFTYNHAGAQGGGMVADGSGVSIVGATILAANSAGDHGGAIITLHNSKLNITGTVALTDNHAGYYGGGMDVQNSTVNITGNVSVIANMCGGFAGGINVHMSSVDILGTMSLMNNSAAGNGGGMDVQDGSVCITGSVSLINNSAGSYGGGISLSSSSMAITGSVLLTDNYSGYQGGGMNVEDSSIHIAGSTSLNANLGHQFGGGIELLHSNMNITVTGSVVFTDNDAGAAGGGVHMQGSSQLVINGSTLFTGNCAGYQGGGMDVHGSSVDITGTVSFISNSAIHDGGGGVALIGSRFDIPGTVSLTSNSANSYGGGITVLNSNMKIARSVFLVRNHAGYSGGGMYAEHIAMDIPGRFSLTTNTAADYGGGVYLSNSTMIIGHVNQTEIGSHGSDSAMELKSGLTAYSNLGSHFLPMTKLIFTENHAKLGGAIFVHDMSPLVYCASDVGAECVIENCFFQINENIFLNNDVLVFKGNVAEAGSVLYGGSVDRCRLEGHPEAHSGEVFDMIANYSKQPDSVSSISSNAFHVCLCENNQPNCNATSIITAYPGKKVIITVTAVGQRNGTVSATIHSITNSSQRSRLAAFQEHQYVSAACTELPYTFFSSQCIIQLIMYVDGSCSSVEGSVDHLTIPVHLLPCPPAFTLSDSTGGCICEERLQKYTDKCNINNQTIQRDGDFWVGYDSQLQGLILHPHCPFDYCKTTSVHFTLNETNLQCEDDRTGLLCGACQPGHSLGLGSSRCMPCSNFYLFLLLPFAIMGLALVLLLLACRLTVAVGTISGLIFYANIVGANRSMFFPPGSRNPLEVFIAWINLDLGIETCFFDGMDAYVKTWLQFTFPIYIIAVVGLILYISERSRRISRLLGSNPVAVLATLFHLSYAKILRTIISALSFTTLQYPNDETRVVWLNDANIKYLQGKHIPLFVVALLFFVFLFLPYTLLLLLGQWLQALSHLKILSWMNNQTLRSFLDAYHAPCKGKHRYWPGLLLVLRCALLLVFGSNALGDNSENLLAISSTSFGLLVWMVGDCAYKNWYLSALEASFILNLGILAVATFYVQQAGGNQAAVAYTSTGVAFATFFAIIFDHMYLQTKGSRFWRVLCCRKDNHRQDNECDGLLEDSGDKPLVAPTTTYVSYGSCVQLREPLLECDAQ